MSASHLRRTGHLRARYRAICSYTGLVLVLCAGLALIPLLALPMHEGNATGPAWAFLFTSAAMAIAGFSAWRFMSPRRDVVLTVPEGGLIVLLSWVVVCLISAWPFMSISRFTFTQAVFESVSGWTTTGLSVLDVSRANPAILLWRSVLQFAGGAGLAIIMLSAIAGPRGPALSVAEGREQLVPHVRESAKLVLAIYSSYTLAGVIALRIAGMGWFDAVNHALASLSTGGFSTRASSIGYWDSIAVEAVVVVLMVLGSTSFITAWLLLRREFRAAGRNGEVRLMAIVVPVCAVLVTVLTARTIYPTLGVSARVAIFQTVTALTTTGFSTVVFDDWNSFGWIVMITLMLIGGGSCSTAGGIKQYRVHLLWKNLVWELRRGLLPRTAVTGNYVWHAGRRIFVDDERLRQIGTFLFLYLTGFLFGTAVLCAHGFGVRESLFEFASALGTVGLSVGITSSASPPGVLWAETAGMFLGRLEFMIIFTSAAKIVRDSWTMVRYARGHGGEINVSKPGQFQ
ncbi:MAG: TrkH family potassium uptake protein [Candidatus Krumholzibacteriota bacterium]|nr:TrkH family potassium uptake protein [Candidatus Krumholzibacteriota bacterium]